MAANPAMPNMEKIHRVVGEMLSEQKFQSVEEADEFLQQILESGELQERVAARPADPREQAQDLAYQAMEAESVAEARKLVRRALKLDPDCVDALVILAQSENLSDEEYIDRLDAALKAGTRALGSDFFKRNGGKFWAMVETRPYMRAKEEMASAYLAIGQIKKAIGEFEDMIVLNPNDNQGVRDPLLGLYLAVDDLESTDRLLRMYAEDASAVFSWARVLRYHLGADLRKARAALANALRNNRYVGDFLAGRLELPEDVPDSYSPGDKGEAAHCILSLGPAWLQHPESMAWVLASLMRSTT